MRRPRRGSDVERRPEGQGGWRGRSSTRKTPSESKSRVHTRYATSRLLCLMTQSVTLGLSPFLFYSLSGHSLSHSVPWRRSRPRQWPDVTAFLLFRLLLVSVIWIDVERSPRRFLRSFLGFRTGWAFVVSTGWADLFELEIFPLPNFS